MQANSKDSIQEDLFPTIDISYMKDEDTKQENMDQKLADCCGWQLLFQVLSKKPDQVLETLSCWNKTLR